MSQFQDFKSNKSQKTSQPWWIKIAKVYLLIFALVIIYLLGVFTANTSVTKQTPEQVISGTSSAFADFFANTDNVDLRVLRQVWDIIHEEFYKKSDISNQDLFYGAVSGMVDALGDPHTLFLSPQLTKEFTQELNGTFYGIGAEIGRRDGQLVIVAPLSGTPADQAGLKPGDRILAIDGRDTSGLSVDEAVYLIRGEKGTQVALYILSTDEETPREVKIARAKIDVPSVVYENKGNIGLITISNFNTDTTDRFRKAAEQARRENVKGIIIDLRNNPGGFLSTAVEIASSWLEPGTVVVRESFSDKRKDQSYNSERAVSLQSFKTVVLVNQGSASASEILAGALQDYSLATVVGQTTFGKGSVQQLQPLADGSSLKVTVAAWLTPNGRTIDGQGIEPDIVVDYTQEDYDNNADPQLDRALSEINQ